MLFVVGLGLEKGDISLNGIAALKKADKVYLERYTLPVPKEYLNFIEEETSKEITEIGRKQLEDDVKRTVGEAKAQNVAILVPGDPLIATTHHLVIDTARKMGIEARVYHSSSIFTAGIGESGLDIYKFGPTTTIPFWSEKYKPVSFLDVIKKNLQNKEHTLVLLDVDPIKQETMSAAHAITTIKSAEEKKGEKIVTGTNILVLCNIGQEDQQIFYTKIKGKSSKLPSSGTEGKRTALIVPATLSFAEEAYVSAFKP